ncbi:MAG: T9SS type A sorting domain-containing protein [Saprospiraceae bacterium]
MQAYVRLFILLVIIGCSLNSLEAQTGLKCLQNLTISTNNGETISTKCSSSDGIDSEIVRFRTNTAATPIGFLVVNDQQIIIHQTTSPFINFSGFSETSLKVYAFSFLGSLNSNIGNSLDDAILATRCYELSNNFIQVSNTPIDRGTLFSNEGTENQTFCHGDGQADLLEVTYQTGESTSAIFITDQNGQVVYLGGDTIIDFEKLAIGIFTIKGISYTGSLLIEKDSFIPADNRLATGCYSLSQENIIIENIMPNGGRISSFNGELPITICRYPDSPKEELITLSVSGQSNQPYTFILVNDEGIIEAISNDNQIDLNDLNPTAKKIYGISLSTTLPFSIGQKWDPTFEGDGCIGVSTNYLEIAFSILRPGTIFNTLNQDTLFYCNVEEGEILELMNDFDNDTGSFQYLITDQNDRPILSLLSTQVNTRLFPEGEFHIWGMQYSGSLSLDYSLPITEQSFSSECQVLSDYPLVFFKYNTQSFEIEMSNGGLSAYLCPNEGFPDIVSFGPKDGGANLLQYVVVSSEGLVLDQTENRVYSFIDYPEGEYQLIGVSYLGTPLDVKGAHIDTAIFSSACFTLSTNPLSITIGALEAGNIELVVPEGGKINSCSPLLTVKFTQESFPSEISTNWIVVDEQQNIAGIEEDETIDWSPYPSGTYQLFGLVYSGDLTAQIGDPFNATNFSNDCFSLSDQAIPVVFSRPDGGELPSETQWTCSSNAEDILSLPLWDDLISPFQNAWVILDLSNNLVVDITDSDTLRSSDYEEGDYQIKRLSYLEYPEGLSIGDIWNSEFSDSSACYAWSSGAIRWKNTEPIAPALSFSEKPNLFIDTICLLKNNRYIVSLTPTFDPDYFHRIIITDDSNVILDENAGLQPDFSAYDGMHILIHSIASLTPVTITKGDTLSQVITQTTQCISVGEVLKIVKTEVGGGRLTSDWGADSDTLYTCLQDGIPDWITIIPTQHSTTANYTLLITNVDDQILGILSNPTRNYDNNIFGELKIYGISHEGPLDFSIGAPISSVKAEGGCWDWADQYLTIISDKVSGGSISSSYGADNFEYCGDGSQQLELQTTSTSKVGYAYLLWGADSIIQRISLTANLPLEGLSKGVYKISAVSFTGIFKLEVGDPISAIPADGCYEWATNTLEFNLLGEVDAGTIQAVGYETDTVYTCPGNGISDVIELKYTSNVEGGPYAFMLTDAADTILYPSIPSTGLLNFENAPEGIYKAYGISYTGQLNGQANRNIRTLELSNECYAWTPNPIIIVNQFPSAGSIYAEGKEGEVQFTSSCDTTKTPESWSFYFNEKTGFSTFVVTTSTGEIIRTLDEGEPFEVPTFYACQSLNIIGMAYSGILQNLEGQNINQLNLDWCYSLSSNQITLIPSEEAQQPPSEPMVINTTYKVSNSFKIYPNPLSSGAALHIEFTTEGMISSDATYYLNVYDIMGRKMVDQRVGAERGSAEIKLGKLPRGIYLIDIWNNNKRLETQQLLIQ